MIHDVLLRELLAKKRLDLANKFWNWAKRHRKRLWIALWWQSISENDTPEGNGQDWRAAVHHDETEEFRRHLGRFDTPPKDVLAPIGDDGYEQ